MNELATELTRQVRHPAMHQTLLRFGSLTAHQYSLAAWRGRVIEHLDEAVGLLRGTLAPTTAASPAAARGPAARSYGERGRRFNGALPASSRQASRQGGQGRVPTGDAMREDGSSRDIQTSGPEEALTALEASPPDPARARALVRSAMLASFLVLLHRGVARGGRAIERQVDLVARPVSPLRSRCVPRGELNRGETGVTDDSDREARHRRLANGLRSASRSRPARSPASPRASPPTAFALAAPGNRPVRQRCWPA